MFSCSCLTVLELWEIEYFNHQLSGSGGDGGEPEDNGKCVDETIRIPGVHYGLDQDLFSVLINDLVIHTVDTISGLFK